MKEHDVKIQSAIWELVTTEVDYIHALQTVTEVNSNQMNFRNFFVQKMFGWQRAVFIFCGNNFRKTKKKIVTINSLFGEKHLQ